MRQGHQPKGPGEICWDPAFSTHMLSPIAQVGSGATEWFLATHSPITCTDNVGPVDQEELFKFLFSASKPETLVIVKGEPGAGKSQLINWLKIRFDDSLGSDEHPSMGDRRVRSVMIRRRSGSLKDALEQLVEQLPEFERYLAKIRAAIDGVSGEAANLRLYKQMYLCLFDARDTAQKHLRLLHEIFNANGTVKWLCRKNGAIDLNIKRLVEQSDATARESLPFFRADDFKFPPSANLGFDGDLADRLADDEVLRNAAASRANEYLRFAIAGLTGLRGDTLNEIFREIREEMQRRGEALALFIEDVSTLSVLDEELVNAVQPLNDPKLCPLVSVLGMTLPAYVRLPDNLKGRIDRVLEISTDSSLKLQEAGDSGIDEFVARYLNGLRAGPDQIRLLADDVRARGDQRQSVCEDCPVKTKCIEAFGSVQFGDVEIGLYPLGPGVARRLLKGLDLDTSLRNPRTLLQHVVLPLLGSIATEFRGSTVGISLKPRSPGDLAVEQDRMLAGWTAEQKGRISYLLYYWTGRETLREGAAILAPMLPWFQHPPFSRLGPSEGKPDNTRPPTDFTRPAPVEPEAPKKYHDSIARLDAWFQQNRPLERDAEYRQLLASVISRSLSLDQVRIPSQRVQGLSGQITAANIEIEGMIKKPAVASKARFVFERSHEIYEFLKDLVGFEHLGKSSWRFPGGEEARRRYGHWLSKREAQYIRAYDITKCDSRAALATGVRFLRLAYRFSLRKDLPSDLAQAVNQIVSFKPTDTFGLSAAINNMSNDLPQRVQAIRKVILDELAVRQGAGGINFIDPRPIIENLSFNADDVSLGEFDGADVEIDFPSISRLQKSQWTMLAEVLQGEHKALETLIYSLETVLRHWHISTENMPEAIREYLESARAVITACEEANQLLGNDNLQERIRSLAPAIVSRHVSMIERGVSVVDGEALAVLSLDVKEVNDTVDLLKQIDAAIRRLQEALSQRLSDVVTTEEVEADQQQAITSIQEFLALCAAESVCPEVEA